jgi:amino acid transporter
MAFCTECGANVPDGIKFCTECGKPMSAPIPVMAAPAGAYAAQPAQPVQQQPQPIPPPMYAAQQAPVSQPMPAAGTDAAVSTWGYIGMLILFSLPLVGWIACIVMAGVAKNKNRRNLAKAMLVLLVIGVILSITCGVLFSWVWEVVLEYAQGYYL